MKDEILCFTNLSLFASLISLARTFPFVSLHFKFFVSLVLIKYLIHYTVPQNFKSDTYTISLNSTLRSRKFAWPRAGRQT